MKIHEYQAKELLSAAVAAVPAGVVVSSPAEAQQAFDKLGGPVVLKAQVHAGGRGKGTFKGSGKDYGGVKFVKSRAEAGEVAETMFRYPLVTKQTGEDGQKVSKVLVVHAAAKIAREYYVGVVLDRSIGLPVVMASAEGGVEIEEVAAKHPEKILKRPIDPDAGPHPFQARRLSYELGFAGDQTPKAEAIIRALAKVFLDKDCSLAEINPLVTTADGDVQVLDAKVTFDDNALFRHPELEKLRDETEEDPAELRAARAGLSYISLTGTIGCLVNAQPVWRAEHDRTLSSITARMPANFLWTWAARARNKEQVTEAFRILLSDPRVKAVLVNIFGGIMKCDIIAAAIIAAFKEVGFHVPLVVRLEGTNVAQGKKMLADSGLNITTADGLTDAAKKVVAAAKA